MTLPAPILVAAEAMAPLLLALLLSAAGLALVFGAVKYASQAVQTTAFTDLLGQFGVDFPEVLV
jgi:hypothetical protein